MLAYAAHRRTIAGRKPAPRALLVIIVAHIALIAAVMSAKMVIPEREDDRTEVELIRLPPPPPPEPQPRADPRPSESQVQQVPRVVPVPLPVDKPVDTSPVPADPNPTIGSAVFPQPRLDPLPLIEPLVRVGPRFATPPSAVRPPYPGSKIASGEEASLRLRLSISPQGRVVAVEPVGAADPSFLAAARKHLLARWKYQPATEGGRPIASSTVISLRFQLDD
jgi:protein TonB